MNSRKYAIAVIAYNRTATLKRLLERLAICIYYDDIVDLHIRIDKSDNSDVESIAKHYNWKHGEKIVTLATERLGLKRNILGCDDLLDDYDAIAVFEDDIIPSIYFYNYMRQAVPVYCDDENIAGISLYSYRVNQRVRRPFEPIQTGYDVFFIQHAISWGQIWMKDAWKKFREWYEGGKNQLFENDNVPRDVCAWSDKSWLKHHISYCVQCDKFFVMPYISLTTNFHCEGEHSFKQNSIYQVPLCRVELDYKFPLFQNDTLRYDVFFENMGLDSSLQIDKSNLTVDLYGNKRTHKRYWLTEKRESFEVLQSFGLTVRPIEANIIDNISGEFFFLYDTSVTLKEHPEHIDEAERLSYDICDYLPRTLLLKLLITNIREAIQKRW